ncbi:MAG: ABC transporter [Burkholderiales bacterium RIFCSPLOWO2_02_FULL_57_36]|nr:MAG: ABC transporter [Burkholderiales bacterium RIFCSPLOWO2_02_FULL_57_36]
MNDFRRGISVFAIAIALAGCATSNNPRDPLEGFNRAMFSFNDAIDQAALKPAATAYQNILPTFVQIAVGNFFGNIGDVWTAANNLLQGKMADGFTDVMRVAVNSTFGLGGLIDIGANAGMTKHKEDFGQTLGVWGIASGPYVVLPFLGPTTMRDSLALPVDVHGDLWSYKSPVHVRNMGALLRVIDQRAAVLDATNLIEDAALDRYEFIRDGFLQRRENNVNDGGSRESRRDDESSLNHIPASFDQDYQGTVAAVQSPTPATELIAHNPNEVQHAVDQGGLPDEQGLQQKSATSDRMTPSMSFNQNQPTFSIE